MASFFNHQNIFSLFMTFLKLSVKWCLPQFDEFVEIFNSIKTLNR